MRETDKLTREKGLSNAEGMKDEMRGDENDDVGCRVDWRCFRASIFAAGLKVSPVSKGLAVVQLVRWEGVKFSLRLAAAVLGGSYQVGKLQSAEQRYCD
jgi:hypothetical protein